MAELRIEDLGEGDPAISAEFPDWDAHALAGDFAHRLYSVVAPAHRDMSFKVMDGDQALLLARATISDQQVSFFGLPARLAPRVGLEGKKLKGAINTALDHMNKAAVERGAETIIIGGPVAEEAGVLATACIDRLAKGETTAWVVADLRQDEALLKRDIRDSYRSLVNWGERNITMKAVNAAAPDRELFERYPAFHAKISSRNMGEAYWQVYWEEILRGKAELLLGWLADGTLVSGSIVVGAGDVAYYASGVYARDQFDKPLGHWPLWQAMTRAKSSGYQWFDAGEVADYTHASDKEASIAFFKRGFTSRRYLRMRWVLPKRN